MGVLTVRGYRCVPIGGDGKKYRGEGKYGTFKLRVRKEVRVVDFDYINYSTRIRSLFIEQVSDEELEPEMKRYREKKCRLLFDPRTRCEKHFNTEQQKVLARYLKAGWTIHDTEGKEVTFTDGGNQKQLDPSLPRTIVFVPVVPQVVEHRLTHGNFLKEFNDLLAK